MFIGYIKLLTNYFSTLFVQIPKIFYLDLDDLQLLNEFLLPYRPGKKFILFIEIILLLVLDPFSLLSFGFEGTS
jgi:hypothetical protein